MRRKNDRFDKPVEITLIYRPPNSGTGNMDELWELIESAAQESLFIGDFNMPDINWREEQSVKYRKIVESVQRAEMVQLVDFSTHEKGNILDLILTN
jgi:hypothetical protein